MSENKLQLLGTQATLRLVRRTTRLRAAILDRADGQVTSMPFGKASACKS